jgi:hypothetical protein
VTGGDALQASVAVPFDEMAKAGFQLSALRSSAQRLPVLFCQSTGAHPLMRPNVRTKDRLGFLVKPPATILFNSSARRCGFFEPGNGDRERQCGYVSSCHWDSGTFQKRVHQVDQQK